MSGYLWKYFLEDDVDHFRQVLENGTHNARTVTQKGLVGWQGGSLGAMMNSPASFGTSPLMSGKGRKGVGFSGVPLTRSDINSRDAIGLTILHHTASSISKHATGFAQALLEHPMTDLYIQDMENGWTALHRAFYFGNIAIARLILNRDTRDILGCGTGGTNQHARGLVKIKDKEGYGPLDLFSMTIKDRPLRLAESHSHNSESDNDDGIAHGDSGDKDDSTSRRRLIRPLVNLEGDEAFTFGSNKNVTLGFGDEDDRQFPERIVLRRPDHLVQRLYREYCESQVQKWASMNLQLNEPESLQPKPITALPTVIRNTPITIQDVQMSKLHTAVLTTDLESNLYMCGHGPGGRLGIGNETTRYQFACIDGGALAHKKVAAIALGQNHSLAVSDEGEIFSWGSNGFGQLGYTLPRSNMKDEEPIQTLPRQIFGPLKRDAVVGIAASRIHSVVHTTTSLYTFGKNEGQLGIVDSDARSLDIQVTPRKIAASLFSSPIASVSAIDGATVCLLENHEVWVFANYGYAKMVFPLDGFTNYFLKTSFLTTKYDVTPNKVCKITCGGDTICALSSSGEVFTVAVSKRSELTQDASTSTTNPSKIRGALSQPYRIWSAKKRHMVARDVAVDQDGSIILTTEAGSVWKRTKRATIKDASAAGIGEYKPKDYKFSRISGLTRVTAVRASAFGAYAAVRKDCDITRNQIGVDEPTLWKDVASLLPFRSLASYEEKSDDEEPLPRFWQKPSQAEVLRKRVLMSKDIEAEVSSIVAQHLREDDFDYDLNIGTTISDVRIPVHQFMFSGRSRVLRQGLESINRGGDFSITDVLTIDQGGDGRPSLIFQGLDFLSVFDLVLYVYTDSVIDFWNVTRQYPKMAFRFRQLRTELMKVASRLELKQLELAVRQMNSPRRSMHMDMELAIRNPSFFDDGDVVVELANGEFQLHSALICQRCPFFQGLFKGRAGGKWLAGRRSLLEEPSDAISVDLKHVELHIFKVVVRHMYCDAGEELFDDVVSEDLNDFLALDELLDHIMDVMSVANELMLDRLSQICQMMVGRYVTARNVCQLLNAISPSSVAKFKDAGLEYLCLSLEAVLQNGSLDELDEDLFVELDQVVRDNQLAYLPFARSGRAEALLLNKYPELAERIDRARRAKIDSIVLSNKFSEADGATSTSFRAQSLEELSASPLRQRTRRKPSKEYKLDPASPSLTPALRGKNSMADLIFEMSEDEGDPPERRSGSQTLGGSILLDRLDGDIPAVGSHNDSWSEVRKKRRSSSHGVGIDDGSPYQSPVPRTPSSAQNVKIPGQPWSTAPLVQAKLELKDIMVQTLSDRPSNLSIGFYKEAKIDERPVGSFITKMSQRERKKLQQAQQLKLPSPPPVLEKSQPTPPTVSPWHADRKSPIGGSPALTSTPQSSRPSGTPQLTMRQTVANSGPASKQNTPTSQQTRNVSNPNMPSLPRPTTSPASNVSSSNPIPAPRSIRHTPIPDAAYSPASPSQRLSIQAILYQQQAEKDVIREAAAKRSLQEIQQEQEFQEWWDQESKRVIQEEESRKRAEEREKSGHGRGHGCRGGRRGRRGRGNKGEGESGDSTPVSTEAWAAASPGTGRQDGAKKGGKSKGKGPRWSGRGSGRGGRAQGSARDGAAATPSPQGAVA
ncbi:hypothetical protein K432DRAFT_409973 [Lepidopterella palustris CBS 459.81]|uniref:BTB domain-containing protein n=1 Tax=Lepidopterella palustris CBS 459.81 TaxID=1314670 RepID=A0A8E2DZ52_9PEZI|nr:hypothetical protein K432DRAFT_409973 [Lepidopterella palustris CBS 459.81]